MGVHEMTAEFIARSLGGRKAGLQFMAKCPAHDDQTPSLAIRDGGDGRVLVYCHSRCPQHMVIGALEKLGLWPSSTSTQHPGPSRDHRPERQDERTAAALAIWRSALPASGTAVAAYLASRGLTLSLPSSLRFHPGLRHPSGSLWPAMVALVTKGTDDKPLAIHRTFLACEGQAKAPVEPEKMMLGPCRGGAVRLAEPGEVLMVGEGIETCLAAMQATRHPAWAALSTSGLRALHLPPGIREVIVLADGDDAGEAAARDCARRWTSGRDVCIARAPRGMDFNDVLLGRGSRIKGDRDDQNYR